MLGTALNRCCCEAEAQSLLSCPGVCHFRLRPLRPVPGVDAGEASGAGTLPSLFHPLVHGSHQGPGGEKPMDPSSVSSLLVTHLGDRR